MNEARRTSRRLDASRDGRVHVEEATDKELAKLYRDNPILQKASAHVVSRRKGVGTGCQMKAQ